MKTKLMITALMFCSSLSLAAEPAPTAPPTTAVAKKKPVKMVMAPPSTDSAQRADEAVLGTGLGTGTAPSTKVVRGKGTAPTK